GVMPTDTRERLQGQLCSAVSSGPRRTVRSRFVAQGGLWWTPRSSPARFPGMAPGCLERSPRKRLGAAGPSRLCPGTSGKRNREGLDTLQAAPGPVLEAPVSLGALWRCSSHFWKLWKLQKVLGTLQDSA
uniref:Uncharacterized protein n=1 Tax=Apteryx owenii TaxID=8824 RepID=A0A8B9Q6R5_APTOW